jgi:hypothetical protein
MSDGTNFKTSVFTWDIPLRYIDDNVENKNSQPQQ